jgi:hypothetical protein
VLSAAFHEPGPYREEITAEIEKAAENFFQSMVLQDPVAPGLRDVVFFNKLKAKIVMHKDKFPADYEYWRSRGWLEADYFFPAKIHPVHKALGTLPVKIIKRTLRRKLGEEVYRKFIGQTPEKGVTP